MNKEELYKEAYAALAKDGALDMMSRIKLKKRQAELGISDEDARALEKQAQRKGASLRGNAGGSAEEKLQRRVAALDSKGVFSSPLSALLKEGFVTINEDEDDEFMLAKYLVTQELWREIMGTSPSFFEGDRMPVESISWTDCKDFINRLNKMDAVREAGLKVRLPLGEEWDAANSECEGHSGWHWENSGRRTHIVGTGDENDLGMFDMAGNVLEWCSDKDGEERLCQGGCWCGEFSNCEEWFPEETRKNFIGMRLAAEKL